MTGWTPTTNLLNTQINRREIRGNRVNTEYHGGNYNVNKER